MRTYIDQVRQRLELLRGEIHSANRIDYYDRLREFKHFCDATPVLRINLEQLPEMAYDIKLKWQNLENRWPEGDAGYGYRWNAIRKVVDGFSEGKSLIFPQMSRPLEETYNQFTTLFFEPLYHYLIDQLGASSSVLYLLVRYKLWVEWFEATKLYKIYKEVGRNGEVELELNLRRFLFESGIDYPFSQPRLPKGQADIVAMLDSEDPLVLEVKIWDSEKGYGIDRVRDGFRQVKYYADKYGKDKGYVVVFNLDAKRLVFVNREHLGEWPPRIERGCTYYFIAVDIAELEKPISEQDKGKPVQVNELELGDLWDAENKLT